MLTLSSGDVCKLTGVAPRTLANWVESGAIRPVVATVGTGNHRRFAVVPDVLAVAVGRGLKASGLSYGVAFAAMEFAMDLSQKRIENAMADGRRFLILVGTVAVPRLASRKEVRDSRAMAGVIKTGVHPTVVDIGAVYENLRTEAVRVAADSLEKVKT